MALLTTPPAGRITSGAGVAVGIGGAESNVAIAPARLGVPVTWISRVGDDTAPTGMMLEELRGGRPWRVRYFRRGSAASRLSVDDVEEKLIASAPILHLSGITPALGPGPLADLGPTAVVKLGALGAVARERSEAVHVGAQAVEVVGTVGARDAFVGECLATATALGTAVCTVPGDWEGIATRAELA